MIPFLLIILFLAVEGIFIWDALRCRKMRLRIAIENLELRKNPNVSDQRWFEHYLELAVLRIGPGLHLNFAIFGLLPLLWLSVYLWTDSKFFNRALITGSTLSFLLVYLAWDAIIRKRDNRLIDRGKGLGGAMCPGCLLGWATNPIPTSCPACGLPINMAALRRFWFGEDEERSLFN